MVLARPNVRITHIEFWNHCKMEFNIIDIRNCGWRLEGEKAKLYVCLTLKSIYNSRCIFDYYYIFYGGYDW